MGVLGGVCVAVLGAGVQGVRGVWRACGKGGMRCVCVCGVGCSSAQLSSHTLALSRACLLLPLLPARLSCTQGVKRPEEQRKRLKRRGDTRTKATGAKQLRDELFGGEGGEQALATHTHARTCNASRHRSCALGASVPFCAVPSLLLLSLSIV